MTRAPHVAPCPNCQGSNLYRTRRQVGSGGGHAPNLLPGLGGFIVPAHFSVVVCRDCGLTRLFANRDATNRLPDSSKWERA